MHESRRRSPRLAGVTSALSVMAMAGCAGPGPTSATTARPGDVSGRYIAVVCDADMPATAFADEQLGPRRTDANDSLTVVTLPIADPASPNADRWSTKVGQAPVSNSVMGPPTSLAISPDGRYAYVVETRGPAGPNARTIADLPVGRKLTCVDLTVPSEPRVLGTVVLGIEPSAVDVHPRGDVVAVVTHKPGAQLALVFVRDGQAEGDPLEWPLLGVEDPQAHPTSVAWDREGSHLAVTIPDTDQVAFYEFRRDRGDGKPGLAPWGRPVKVGKFPFSGRFTPDGRYFISTDLQWGPDVEGFMTGAPPGRLSVIRVSGVPSAVVPAADGSSELRDDLVVHELVSTAVVGISPECLAISSDGRYVVTANLRRSFLREGDPNLTRGGSLSLLEFDASSGTLNPVREIDIPSMPQGLCFDARCEHLVVSQFRSFDSSAVDGELAFFTLVRSSPPRLVPADFFVGVGVGPHGIVIVR